MSLSNLLSGSAILCSIISCSVSDFLHANICLLACLLWFFQTQKKMTVLMIFFPVDSVCSHIEVLYFIPGMIYFFPTSVLVAFCDTSASRVQYLRQLFSFPGLTASNWTVVTEFLVCFD